MAIVVDANVASEIISPRTHPVVRAWWRSQVATDLFTTAITEAEMRYGFAIMPAGRRRDDLTVRADFLFGYFAGRILPFDRAAARAYADIFASRRALGRPIDRADCQIAAIARAQGMAVATRNVSDFRNCGVRVLNPWAADVII